MAITLNGTGSGFNRSVINDNFQKIEDELNNNVLRRGNVFGDEDNAMREDLDMNSQRILNLPKPENAFEPARLIDLSNIIGDINLTPNASEVEFDGTVDYAANNVEDALEKESDLRIALENRVAFAEGNLDANNLQLGLLDSEVTVLQNEMVVVQQRSLNNLVSISSLSSSKADRDQDAVVDNIAVFDSSGNPVDSGLSVSDVVASVTTFAQEDEPTGQVVNGTLWFIPSEGTTYIWYQDVDSGQWVEQSTIGLTGLERTILSYDTTAEMENSSPEFEGQRAENRERSNAQYVLAPSGYIALPGDVVAANGRVWELQIDGQVLSGWFGSLDDAVSRGRDVLVTDNYTVSSVLSINCTTEAFTIDLAGHTLTSNNEGIFSAFGGLLYEQNVSSHTANTITIGASNDLVDYLVDNIDNRPVIKIVSDDVIDVNESANERRGEFARVVSVAGGVITLETDLYFTYTTAPRVAALVSKKFTLKNGKLDISDLATVRGAHIFCTKLYQPVLEDIEILKGNDAGVVLRSCYESKVIRPSIHNLTDNAGGGFFGYGIDDSSSHATLVTDGDFSNTRHAYTTNTGESTAGGDMAAFGATMYSKVKDCTCTGNSDDAFDTHPNSYFVTFENVKGYRNVKGLVKDRGKFTTVSCQSYGDDYGVRTAARSDNMKVKSLISEDTLYPLFLATSADSNVHIMDGEFDLTSGNEFCRLINTNLSGNIRAKYRGSANYAKVFRLDNSKINMSSVELDLLDATSANYRVVEIAAGDSNVADIHCADIKSVPDAINISYVSDASGESTNKATFRHVNSVDYDQLSGNTLASGSYSISKWSTGHSSSFFVTLTAGDQGIPELIYNGSPKITMVATVTGSSKNLVTLPDGVYVGQQLQIVLSKNSAFNVTIRHGSTYNTDLIGAANITLGQGESLSLMWNGTDWESFVQTN